MAADGIPETTATGGLGPVRNWDRVTIGTGARRSGTVIDTREPAPGVFLYIVAFDDGSTRLVELGGDAEVRHRKLAELEAGEPTAWAVRRLRRLNRRHRRRQLREMKSKADKQAPRTGQSGH